MPVILLLFPNTSSLIFNFSMLYFCTSILNLFMHVYGQLSAIKDLYYINDFIIIFII